MRNSPVIRVPNSRVVVLREDLISACDGALETAVFISLLEYWTTVKRRMKNQIEHENKAREQEGLPPLPLDEEDFEWVYKTYEEWIEESLGLLTRHSLKKAIRHAQELGFVSIRRNPKYRWDKTHQYRLNVDALNRKLEEVVQTLETHDRSSATYRKNEFVLSESRNRPMEGLNSSYGKVKTDPAIPEITIQRLHTEKENIEREDTYVSSDTLERVSSNNTHPPTPGNHTDSQSSSSYVEETTSKEGGGVRDPVFDGLIEVLQGKTSRLTEWVEAVEEIHSKVGWDERANRYLGELIEKTFITPKRLLSVLNGRSGEIAKKYGTHHCLKLILDRVNTAVESGDRKTKTLIGELTLKNHRKLELDPKVVYDVYVAAVERFPEFRPIPWSETLRRRILEIMKRSARFRDIGFWEKLFRKARDYVAYLSERKKGEQTRDLFWILNDKVFEWIEADTRKEFAIVTIKLGEKFINDLKERLEEQVLEVLKKDMFASVASYSKNGDGLLLSAWKPSPLVQALDKAGSVERFLEVFYRPEYVQRIFKEVKKDGET